MGEVQDRGDDGRSVDEDDGEREPDGDLVEPGHLGDGDRDRGVVAPLAPIDQATLVEILEYIAKGLVEAPDAVAVEMVEREGGVTLRLRVDQPDMGKVIGRAGRTARAIRTLMRAAGTRAGVSAHVEIVEE